MNQRRFTAYILAIWLLFSCTACKRKVSPTITDLQNISGLNIGVVLGWTEDFYFTGKKDITLYRYDSISDMLLGLVYGIADAIVSDCFTTKTIEQKSTGISHNEDIYFVSGIVTYFAPEQEELCEQYNTFVAEFRETDEGKDWQRRMDEFDGIYPETLDIPLTGTGEILRIGYDIEEYPCSFKEADGRYRGYFYEVLCRFANAYNYRLELYDSNYNDCWKGVLYGLYDVGFCWAEEQTVDAARQAGILVSEPLIYAKEYLMQVTDAENLSISQYVEYIDE